MERREDNPHREEVPMIVRIDKLLTELPPPSDPDPAGGPEPPLDQRLHGRRFLQR